jgi:3-deoxy-7-phosphoheptulonate synthase
MPESEPIEDRNLISIRPLLPPRELKARLPLTPAAATTVSGARGAIRDVLHGRDAKRLVIVVGPCSIHDPEAAIDYAQRLVALSGPVADELVLVMRTYFEKPRTTVGWKGLINDPHLDGTHAVEEGLEIARRLLLEINELGISCATEWLDPFTPQFLADLMSWASIGARTSESQTHRQLASGLSMPVGFKNGTDGSTDSARNAMVAAGHPHSFLGICADGTSAVVNTRGNPDRHIVLRGGTSGPNYEAAHIEEATGQVANLGIARPVMVDCSHGNSGKDPARQPVVAREVVGEIHQAKGDASPLAGLMLESNLETGSQAWSHGASLRRGVSITDACLGWAETEDLLYEIAETVKRSR